MVLNYDAQPDELNRMREVHIKSTLKNNFHLLEWQKIQRLEMFSYLLVILWE